MGNSNITSKTEKIGFKVVEVVPSSPGHKCGLVEMIDFILSVNGSPLSMMSKESIIDLVKVRIFMCLIYFK
jgi:C-terminal processing protease CtpA/Prc